MLLLLLLLLLQVLLLLFSAVVAVAVAAGVASADENLARRIPNRADFGPTWDRTGGQQPRPPPGGWSEVGDRNKGAFRAASQKQQNHYFCCAKLQMSGLNVISTKHNTDCGTTGNRSN